MPGLAAEGPFEPGRVPVVRRQDPAVSPVSDGGQVAGVVLERIVESCSEAVVVLDAVRDDQGRVVDFVWRLVNPAAERLVGRSAAELLSRRLLVEMPGVHHDGLFTRFVEALENGTVSRWEHFYGHEGMQHWFRTTVAPVDGGVVVIVGDLTDHKRLELELARLTFRDDVTGLANGALLRSHLQQALARLLRRRGAVAVLFVGLDRFEAINDSLGHQAGDALLGSVGQRLQQVCRPGDTVARFAGDQFAIVCDELSTPYEAGVIAHRVCQAFDDPFDSAHGDLPLSASIGVAQTSDPHRQPDELLQGAETAMNQAKRDGDAVAFFDESLRHAAHSRLTTEQGLRHVATRSELRLHYQPIMTVADDAMIGCEALVRWQHPQRGLLWPAEFVGIAEDSGLIIPIGEWVIDEACRQLTAWDGADSSLTMAVNVSAHQLVRDDFVGFAADTLSRYELDPSRLYLEITETALLRDPHAARGSLGALADLGVKLALDDFGTGYSSLSHLLQYPVDQIKLDRSFVSSIDHSRQRRAIAHAFTSLAHALDMTVTAEGVATVEELDELRRLGIDHAQGYHWSRPLPAEEFQTLQQAAANPAAQPRRSPTARRHTDHHLTGAHRRRDLGHG